MMKMFCDWHKNQANIFLHIIALTLLIYGIAVKSCMWIIIAILVAGLGHVVQALAEKKAKPKRRK